MSEFPAEGYRFLGELALNNDRDWFTAHKKDYEKFVKKPGERLAEELKELVSAGFGQEFDTKIYRIYRDVRFSKDKTPYNAYWRLTLMPTIDPGEKRTCDKPAFHVSIEPDKVIAGLGMFGFEGEMLARYREFVVDDETGAEMGALVEELISQGARLHEPELKKVPRGFDADHPRAELLKSKGFAMWVDDSSAQEAGVGVSSGQVMGVFERFRGLYECLKKIG